MSQLLLGLRQTSSCLGRQIRRNIGVSAPAMAKAAQNLDPIQKLFHEKLMQYSDLSKKSGGKLVESTPELEKQLSDELAKIDKMYGGGSGKDMTAFPTFSFSDSSLEKIDLGIDRAAAAKDLAAKKSAVKSAETEVQDLSDTPFFSI